MTDRLPSVLRQRATENAVEFDLNIDPGMPWFLGHFPGTPILPGVVPVDRAVGFARSRMAIDMPSGQAFQVRFKAVIAPEDPLTLSLRHDATKGRVALEYRHGAKPYSTGAIFVGAT